MNIEELGQKNRAIPGWLRFLVAAPFLGIASYWVFGYHGLYRVLAELEMSIFGAYEVFLTGAITYLLCMVPIFPIFRLLRKKYDKPPEAKPSGRLELLMKQHPRSFKYVIVFGSVAGIAVVVGVYMMIVSLLYGPKTYIELSDLKNNTVDSKYVEFTAKQMYHQGFGMTESHGSSETSKVYVPVFQNRLEKITDPFYCIVEFYEKTYDNLSVGNGPIELHGTLSKNSLPGLIRTEMDDKLGTDYWVLRYNHKPSSDLDFGWIMLAVGAGFGVIFFFVRRRAMKKVS
jgi:hypothetical protein